MDESVGDRGGHRRGIKHRSPLRKRQIGGNHRRFMLMPLADDLEEQVRALLTERQITEFVH